MGLIFRLILRHIKRRRLQSGLFVLGVALGVAVGVAIDLANTSANRAFNLSAESISGRTTHQIIGGPSGLERDLFPQVQAIAPQSAPIIAGYVRAIDFDDQPLQLLGVDPVAELPFRDYLRDEIPPDVDLETYSRLFASSQSGVIGQVLAERYSLAVGDSINIRVNAQRYSVRLVGIISAGDGFNDQALNDLLVMHIDNAGAMLGRPERLSRIDLILADNPDLSPLEAILPPNAAILTPQQRTGALSQMTEAFEINLRALSLLALVVGVFLIYNTVMFSVVQRRKVIGIMRSLGTSRRQIFLLVTGEALFLGAIGTALGLGLGVLMGQGTVNAVSQTVNDLYFRVNVQETLINPTTLAMGGFVGLLASLTAAILPAIDATFTTPAGSMRRSELEHNAQKLLPFVTAGGALLILSGFLLLQIKTDNLILSFAALFMVVIGAALFTPLGMVIFLSAIMPLTGRLFGLLGRMAPRAVVRALSRTSVAVAALTLAVSVIVGVGVMISSFRVTVVDWLDLTLGADIYISTPNLSTDSAANIDPEIIPLLAGVEGVRLVGVVREAQIIAPDYPDLPPIEVSAVDMDVSEGQRRFAWSEVPQGVDYRDRLPAGYVMVSEAFAFRRGITRENNQITLLTDQGAQSFHIFAVYYDYTSDQGRLMMDLEIYRQYFDDPFITSAAVFVEDESQVSAVIERLRREALNGLELQTQSYAELRAGALEVFDRTFSITVALQLLAIVVAFIGILSALMALQLEHIREYGILRANGMTPRQIRGLTLLQTGLMGLSAGVMAIPIGLILAYILIYVINVRSFGWTMNLILPPSQFIQAFGVAIIAALLAGIYPAWRVSSIQAAEAVRSE